jgi:hypothetical protein
MDSLTRAGHIILTTKEFATTSLRYADTCMLAQMSACCEP